MKDKTLKQWLDENDGHNFSTLARGWGMTPQNVASFGATWVVGELNGAPVAYNPRFVRSLPKDGTTPALPAPLDLEIAGKVCELYALIKTKLGVDDAS